MTDSVADSPELPTCFDVVILSFAKDEALRQVTEHCLDSLVASENPAKIRFRVWVLESNADSPVYRQPGVTTLYPNTVFNYHAYMNLGIREGQAPYVAICNNDLSFHPGWASELLEVFNGDPGVSSASPACSLHHPRNGFALHSGVYPGYGVLREISGWCLVFRRSILDVIGELDERFYFWYADNDYALTLQSRGLRHVLVTSSVVDHLDSRTLSTHTSARQWLMTKRSKYTFEEKWHGKGWGYLTRKKLKLYLKFPLYYFGLKKIK
ncbi:Glycosyltransferase, GT2 family [Pseudomonas flavescens]|uniref:Glycosyltransferase, GT2 family n=1 Tax=Phytopseudomonas flavescens TaxID=29435 RepID=A0A1G8PEH4_9GAMM|nr:glycosyltransferase [Pseudomonas flavescens]SDI90140.1 Glycosyltransferase, GT2 family [Pseudomonas flavescens]